MEVAGCALPESAELLPANGWVKRPRQELSVFERGLQAWPRSLRAISTGHSTSRPRHFVRSGTESDCRDKTRRATRRARGQQPGTNQQGKRSEKFPMAKTSAREPQ